MKKQSEKIIEKSALHTIPDNLKKLLLSNDELLNKWSALTPIARNEWICWITVPKKEETKTERLKRLVEDILNEKKKTMLLAWLSAQKSK